MATEDPSQKGLEERIESSLNGDPSRPRCVHGLYEELLAPEGGANRDDLLDLTRRAAGDLVEHGRARRRYVSAIAIGAHCEDEVFWSVQSPHRELEDFGPEYEQLAIARRLASHFVCRGL
ncbi:MAG: hypothetical protein ACLPZM_07545 [Thermoplasmata archaeon]